MPPDLSFPSTRKVVHKKMSRLKIALSIIAVTILSSYGTAQQLLFSIRDTGSANTNIQSTPPAALIMSAGACLQGPNCSTFGAGMNNLNPLLFYPSSHWQTVTITSAWGPSFNTFASVFSPGGNLNLWVPQFLTDDGLVPSNFFQSNQSGGGPLYSNPATVSSVVIVLAPFTFQQMPAGWWEAIGTGGQPPVLTIRVYGKY